MAAFSPQPGLTYRVTVDAAATTLAVPASPDVIRVFNATAANVLYVEPSGATPVVPVAYTGVPATGGTPGSIAVAGGAGSLPVLIAKGKSTSIGLIASGANTDVYITLGHGDSVG